jgi:hypothetical protein
MTKAASLVFATALMLSACDGGGSTSASESPASQTTTETPEPEAAAPPQRECANETSALADRELFRPDPLDGDVDGDGSADEVRLVVDRSARPGCQAFVAVSTATGRLSGAIAEPNLLFDLGLPSLTALVAVDDRAGDEILVLIEAGASTQFFGLFTAAEQELHRVAVERGKNAADLTFASGGSVGHLDAVDCIGDRVVISSAVPKGDRYRVRRTFYSKGVVLAQEDEERLVANTKELAAFPEFQSTPFGNCDQA